MRTVPVTILLCALAFLTASCEKQQAAQGPPPNAVVSVITVEQHDVPIYGDWVATLQGYQNAQIQPQVSGYLIRQDYREGVNSSQRARCSSRSIHARFRRRSIRQKGNSRRRRAN